MPFSRRDFLRLGSAALLGSMLPRQLAPALSPSAEPFDKSVIYHGSRKLRTVAMTYDDCWHPEVLEQLMEMVKPYPAFHFTFFAIGDAIDIDEQVRPGIFKRLYEAGHEIGYHTYHHVDPQVMTLGNLQTDFDQWMVTLRRALGSEPKVHFARPPYDDLSLSFLELCRQRGMVATLYSAGFESPDMAESMRLAAKAVNGDIVQMHTYQDPPHGRYDVDITAKAVPYLAEQGFTLVTMSELYDGVLREQYSSDGCNTGAGSALTRTCLE
jgi:peptidoglycan/xylan/chitin deacetylase (PgdA/CDA1 family)